MSIYHKNNPVKYWLGRKQTTEMRIKKSKKMMGNQHLLGKTWKVPTRRNPFKSLAFFLRGTQRMIRWRNAVYKRDKWTCRECGQRGGKLNADHIKTFSNILLENNIQTEKDAYGCEELWNINNGRTLCIECHKKTDTFAGRARKLNKLITGYY